MKRILLLAVACIAVACWTGGAVAGNGNGVTPPGQEKKADASATSTTPGVKPSSTTSKRITCSTGGTGAATTCTPGTKPDSSKQYGNGKTAAQIATSRGAPADTAIYGPGNSQPHKVTSCKHPLHGKGGGVDVHAVKSYSTDCSTQQQQSEQQSEEQSTQVETNCAGTTVVTTSSSTRTVAANKQGRAKLHGNAGSHGKHKGLTSSQVTSSSTTSTFTPSGANCATVNANAAATNNTVMQAFTPAVAPAVRPAGFAAMRAMGQPAGVLGAQATITKPAKHSAGMLGAVSRLGKAGVRASLPFTGFPLWLTVFAALVLLAGGLVARGRRGHTQR
jgi:hypothetical protein